MTDTDLVPGEAIELSHWYLRRDNGDQVFTFTDGETSYLVYAYEAPHSPQVFKFPNQVRVGAAFQATRNRMDREASKAEGWTGDPLMRILEGDDDGS